MVFVMGSLLSGLSSQVCIASHLGFTNLCYFYVNLSELNIRDSDSQSSRTAMMCKARDSGHLSSEFRKVNFVIFAVNGLSVLKSLESEEDAETQYTQLIASAFNCPYLAFKG